MITRRQALRIAGSTAVLGSVSGCLGVANEGSVNVRIENRDDQQHIVDVTFENDGEAVFSDQYTVSADEEATASDVVDAGEYLVTVELDTSNATTVDFTMSGCDSNSLFVAVHEDGELEAGVLDEC